MNRIEEGKEFAETLGIDLVELGVEIRLCVYQNIFLHRVHKRIRDLYAEVRTAAQRLSSVVEELGLKAIHEHVASETDLYGDSVWQVLAYSASNGLFSQLAAGPVEQIREAIDVISKAIERGESMTEPDPDLEDLRENASARIKGKFNGLYLKQHHADYAALHVAKALKRAEKAVGFNGAYIMYYLGYYGSLPESRSSEDAQIQKFKNARTRAARLWL